MALRDSIQPTLQGRVLVDSNLHCPEVPLSSFDTVDQNYVLEVVKSMKKTTCCLDLMPTNIFCDKYLASVLELVVVIFNQSILTGVVPGDMKAAVILPVLKKPNLDLSIHNYRPVSNLPFLSKVLEKIIYRQLVDYLTLNDLHEPYQSGFTSGCSTETALLRVQADLLQVLDEHDIAVLALLDLSSAFDTIDHSLLCRRLAEWYNISDLALSWLHSYVSLRSQFVKIGECRSDQYPLTFGVPRGSILGPLLFKMYLAPLSTLIRAHDVAFHMYADDIQVYVNCHPTNISAALTMLENCITDICHWLANNYLKCNTQKTEVLLLGSSYNLSPLSNVTLNVHGTVIESVRRVKNLGTIFDAGLTMSPFVSAKCQSLAFQLRAIRSIRGYLNEHSTNVLVCSLFNSRLDYCNSLLYGLPQLELHRLQILQNRAARLVVQSGLYEHITPVLIDLHWLPVEARILYKYILITYKCIAGGAPQYLSSLLHIRSCPINTRQSAAPSFVRPLAISSRGYRSFNCAAPDTWAILPENLKICSNFNEFKSGLKTFLFRRYFNIV